MKDFGTVKGSTQEVRIGLINPPLKPKIPFPHRHDFYKIMAVTSGTGWHEIDFNRKPIGPYQIFFIKPGQVHDWHIPSKASGYFVEFGSEAIVRSSIFIHPSWSVNQLSDYFELNKSPKIVREAIWDIFNLMHEEYEAEGSDFESSLRYYLMVLLIELRRLSKGKVSTTHDGDPLLERFLILIEENFCREHGMNFYAKKLRTTPKALTMKASRGLGKSARKILHDRLVLEAKRLLAYSNFTISEVAFEVGFEDPNYFSRFFRKATRVIPGHFRAKAKNHKAK